MYGEKIKTFLDEKGIKYTFIADEMGMSMSTFSALLNGKRKIAVEEYFMLCSILGVAPDFFVKQVENAS